MWGIVRETQRSSAGKFGPPKSGFPRVLDVVAIGSWYQYQVANRASPKHAETPVIGTFSIAAWYYASLRRTEAIGRPVGDEDWLKMLE